MLINRNNTYPSSEVLLSDDGESLNFIFDNINGSTFYIDYYKNEEFKAFLLNDNSEIEYHLKEEEKAELLYMMKKHCIKKHRCNITDLFKRDILHCASASVFLYHLRKGDILYNEDSRIIIKEQNNRYFIIHVPNDNDPQNIDYTWDSKSLSLNEMKSFAEKNYIFKWRIL